VLLMPARGPGRGWPTALDAWRDRIEVAVAADGRLPARSVYLVRPDGYVAARGSVARPGRLLDYLRQLYGDADRGDPALATTDAG
jgi:hypothetical protein